MTGRYFQDSAEGPVIDPKELETDPEPVGVAEYALAPTAAERLWELFATAVSGRRP
ncbi:hypothetical protein ACFWP5_13715 [Streptomyces sp. NPDC058469]|uniref:hypothetical protein n=1 Tax=Streptomyces sp. NPDC058469 TaxID=3346514 RepID=UPI003655BCAB